MIPFLAPSHYNLDELIDSWSKKYPDTEITANSIFNLAYNNKLTLHVKKISWPYRIWAYREIFVDDEIGFCSEYPDLSLVETGCLSLYDVEVTTFNSNKISKEDVLVSIEADYFFDDTPIPEEISSKDVKKRKSELVQAEYALQHFSPVSNHDFLELSIGDFSRLVDGGFVKGYYQLDNIKMPRVFFKTISMELLDGFDLDAKDYIADQFNDPLHEYIQRESAITNEELKKGNTKSRWTAEEKENGLNCPLEYPSKQVQIEYTATIKASDIYILRSDKEQAEVFLNDVDKGKNHSTPKKHAETCFDGPLNKGEVPISKRDL